MAVDTEEIKAKIKVVIEGLFTHGTPNDHDNTLSTRRITTMLLAHIPGKFDEFEVYEAMEEMNFQTIRIGNVIEWCIKNK